MATVLPWARLGRTSKPRKSRYATRQYAASSINKEAVHILGVDGTGMRPVTFLAHWQGYDVRGSDAKPLSSDIQNLQGLKLLNGRLQVSDLPDLVVASSAIERTHPDLELARKHRVPVLSRRQWFRKSLSNFRQITVSGTHGKTTTSSMIAYVLHEKGVRVPFIVGGEIPQLPLGTSCAAVDSNETQMLVVEADEYGETFLGLSPMVSVLTNIGHDHVDLFRTQQDVDDSFALFLGRMRRGGVLVANGDDPGCRRVVRQAVASECIVTWQEFIGMSSHQQASSKVVLFYGFNGDNDITLHASDASWDDLDSTGSIDGSSWHSITRMMWAMPEIRYEEAFMGHDQSFSSHFTYHLQLLGDHNASNAAGAVLAAAISHAMFRNSFSTACETLSVGKAEVLESLKQVSHHVHTFTGTHRRLECLKSTTMAEGGVQKAITVYDDYAHHPTECQASLQAVAQAHPGAQIWIVWEPITRSRLEHFLKDFVEAFTVADTVIVGPIDISREEDDPGKDQELLQTLQDRLGAAVHRNKASLDDTIMIAESWTEANGQLSSRLVREMSSGVDSNTVVMFLGASQITHTAHAFAESAYLGS